MDFEPNVVIVPVTAGTTPEARYRSDLHTAMNELGSALPAHKPLVMLVRLNPISQSDVLSVDARREGSKITVSIEHRMAMCGPGRDPGKNTSRGWVPLIEADLGALPGGNYQVVVDEQVLQFGNGRIDASSCDPKQAKLVGHGYGYSGGISVI